jgi:hypothetical protein
MQDGVPQVPLSFRTDLLSIPRRYPCKECLRHCSKRESQFPTRIMRELTYVTTFSIWLVISYRSWGLQAPADSFMFRLL